jgi:regulatory protein
LDIRNWILGIRVKVSLPIITKLKTQKDRNRVNLYLDHQFAFGLSLKEVVKLGLTVGQKLTEEEVEKLLFSRQEEKLYQKTLNFLSYRPRSEKEIKDYLVRKRANPKIQTSILKKLRKLNFINDEDFARWWLEQRMSFRPRGKPLLRRELFQKGIEKKIIDSLISQISPFSQINSARKIMAKKKKLYQNLPLQKLRQKLFSLLARRGFEFELIKEAIDEEIKKR